MARIVLIATIVVTVFLAGAAFSERLSFTQTESPKQISKEEPIKNDWPRQQSQEYKFSFSYPPGASVSPTTVNEGWGVGGYNINGPGDFTQTIWVYATDCDLACFNKELVEWYPKTRLSGQEKTINGYKGFEINLDGNPDNHGPVVRHIYLTNEKGTVVYMNVPYLKSTTAPLSDNQQKILDSIRFSGREY